VIHIVTIRYVGEKQFYCSDDIIPFNKTSIEQATFLRRPAMNCSSGNKISASKTIGYIKARLSGQKRPAIDIQLAPFEDMDKTIAHMRKRLKSASLPQYGD
jgi:hypothetical protein